MECIILVRLNSGRVVAIAEEDDSLSVFPNYEDALELTDSHILCKRMPYQIVELDEL